MKKLLYISIIILWGNAINAQTINLASGTTGSTTGVGQSYNESRGVDVTVLSPTNINVTAMTLGGFFCGTGGVAYVDARIFDGASGTLLAGANDTVTGVFGGSVTVPISFTLLSGGHYLIAFYAAGPNPPTNNSGLMFDPTAFPYTEPTGALRINQAKESIADVMPANNNIFVPLITLHIFSISAGVDEIGMGNNSVVYPNPFNQLTTLQFSNNAKQNCSLIIYNEEGKLVRTIINITTDKVEIERGDLANGIYFYQLKTAESIINKGKFVIE